SPTKTPSSMFLVARAATCLPFLDAQKWQKDARGAAPPTPLYGHKNGCKYLSSPLRHARLKNTGIRSAKIKFHASQPVFLRFACGKLPTCSQFKSKRPAPVFARGFDISFSLEN
ncbi:MAG TPA: hypothetical protein VHO66_09785, partial [Ruminiclostridium sp.]|nr:hypothetical protein [Ruminiclostridium sp.]